jgi:hypothetical protein
MNLPLRKSRSQVLFFSSDIASRRGHEGDQRVTEGLLQGSPRYWRAAEANRTHGGPRDPIDLDVPMCPMDPEWGHRLNSPTEGGRPLLGRKPPYGRPTGVAEAIARQRTRRGLWRSFSPE